MDQKDLDFIQDYLIKMGESGARLAKLMDTIKNDQFIFNTYLKEAKDEATKMNSSFNNLSLTFKNILDDLKDYDSTSRLINKNFKTLGGLADKLKYDAEDISKLSLKDLKSIKSKVEIQILELRERKKDLELKQKSVGLNEQEGDQLKELQGTFNENNKLRLKEENAVYGIWLLTQKRIQQEKDINKNLGITGVLSKSIENTLSKWGVDTSFFEDLNKKLREAAKPDSLKKPIQVLQEELKKGLSEALKDPLAQITIGLRLVKSGINDIKKSFESFKEYDTLFTNLARGLGMSTDQVRNMTINAKRSKEALEGNNYTSAQIAKSIEDINSQLGLSVGVSAATTDEFTAMTNQMGLSAEEASNIYRIGLLSNSSLKDTNKNIAKNIITTQKQLGVKVNEKQVFQEIGKLSAGITAKFQQNPDLIAKAVVQAKALGTNLEQVDKIGESLLNFESSIENELKAELLTGKQINLEKARYAALTGDQIGLMNELSSQVGSLEEFQSMNVLAQKSLAEAFGLSKDELANMLKQQEIFNKLGDVSGKTAEEQLKIALKRGLTADDALVQNLKQQAAAEKLASAFDSIKVSLAELVSGPFKLLADIMSYVSKHAWIVHAAVGAIAAISLSKLIGGVALLVKGLSTALASTITLEGLLTGGAAILGLGALLGVAIGAVSSIASATESSVPQLKEGGVVPAVPGGTLVNVGEAGKAEAIIPLNTAKADEMLGIKSPTSNTTFQSSLDLTPMINAINEVRTAVASLANRPINTNISIDGKAIGTAIGKQMETGTAQNQYTGYKIA